jgi:hypothetical protein
MLKYWNRCLSVCLSIYLWLYSSLLGLGRLYSFLILHTVGRTPWTGDQPVARPLSIHSTTQTRNKCTQTSMPWVGFEPRTQLFERAKTLHALGRAATVNGTRITGVIYIKWRCNDLKWNDPSIDFLFKLATLFKLYLKGLRDNMHIKI